MITITTPTNATAPAAPPSIAARVLDIWYRSHFSYTVECLSDKNGTRKKQSLFVRTAYDKIMV